MSLLSSILVTLLLLMGSAVSAQQKPQKPVRPQAPAAKTQARPLTATQRNQIAVYRKINELVKQGKADEKLIFNSFYSLIGEHCAALQEKNLAASSRNEENADKAKQEGNTAKMKACETASQLYRQAAKTAADLEKAIAGARRSEAVKLVDDYIRIENQIRDLRFRPVAREWFSVQETIKALYSPKKQ